MSPEEMAKTATEAINGGTRMTMTLPRPWIGRPQKFPRGELMAETEGRNVYSFDPVKVLAWLVANGLVTVTAKLKQPSA